ncbi:MAG: hypothetical protein ABW048_04250, partial [Sphingobium sp.]
QSRRQKARNDAACDDSQQQEQTKGDDFQTILQISDAGLLSTSGAWSPPSSHPGSYLVGQASALLHAQTCWQANQGIWGSVAARDEIARTAKLLMPYNARP